MPMSLEEQIRQHKINRDHELRLRAAERNAADGLDAVAQVADAVKAMLDRLVEKGVLPAEEADALRQMIGPIPAPLRPVPDVPPASASEEPPAVADPSIADTQAAALAALSDAAHAEEGQSMQDEPAADQT